jgi:MFS transporter, SP family, arabinose:H+ symporter
MNQRLGNTILAGSFCGLLFGYDIGALSSAAPGLRAQFALSGSAFGFAVSSALIGTIAGSMAAGFLADAFDRRTTLLISGFLYLFAQLGAAFAPGLVPFAICRIVCGVAIGLISVAVPMYLAEVSPAQLRGRIVGSFQFSVSIGVVLAFGLGYLLSSHMQPGASWRYTLAAGAIPALLCEIFLQRSSPSPRWLAIKGRFAEVRSAFEELGSSDPEADEAQLETAMAESNSSRKSSLFAPQHTRPILLAVSIAMFNQLTGVNALLYYILDIFADLGSGRLNGRRDAILVSALSLVVTMLAVGLIDKVGRRPLLLAGTIGMGVCLALFPAIRYMYWPASTVVIVLASYNAFFGFSQGAVVWVYLSEIFPLPIRARGQSLGSTVHWITNAFVVGTFPALTTYLRERVFVVFALLMALQFLTVLFFYPETKRARLESLASKISSKALADGKDESSVDRKERFYNSP